MSEDIESPATEVVENEVSTADLNIEELEGVDGGGKYSTLATAGCPVSSISSYSSANSNS